MPLFFESDNLDLTRPPALCTRSTAPAPEDMATARDNRSTDICKPQQTYQVPDRYAPPIFDGVHPDPEEWLAHFRRYVACRNLSESDQLAFFPLFLQHRAIDWYDTLKPQDKTTIDELLGEFNRFFCPSALEHALDAETVFTRMQRPSEKVRDYFSAMQKLAKRMPGVDEDLLQGILIRGLLPQIKAFVLQHQGTAKSIGDILELARVAETAGVLNATAAQSDMTSVMEEIRASRAELRQLTNRMDRMSLNAVGGWSPSPEGTLRQYPYWYAIIEESDCLLEDI